MSYDADPVEPAGNAAFENPITNHIIHSEVNLTQGEKIQGAKVIGHKKTLIVTLLSNTTTTHYSTPCYMTLSYLISKSKNIVKML